mmetsp:Transcript_42822/g.87545  ORF Transcript_42822/g.87545 Transcript_42822/m.87545 type:complete len:89 (-) Transcript_42822:5396-5662(-)
MATVTKPAKEPSSFGSSEVVMEGRGSTTGSVVLIVSVSAFTSVDSALESIAVVTQSRATVCIADPDVALSMAVLAEGVVLGEDSSSVE